MKHGLDELLRAKDFVGVDAAINPHHRLAERGKRPGISLAESFRLSQTLRDVFVLRKLLLILWRRHDRHHHRAPFRRLADIHHRHPIGFLIQLFPVRGHLRIIHQEVVLSYIVAKLLTRRGDVLLGFKRC